MFNVLCFTKAMILKLFSEKHWEQELNYFFWFPPSSYVHLDRQRISPSDGKCRADICQQDQGLLPTAVAQEEVKTLFQLIFRGQQQSFLFEWRPVLQKCARLALFLRKSIKGSKHRSVCSRGSQSSLSMTERPGCSVCVWGTSKVKTETAAGVSHLQNWVAT